MAVDASWPNCVAFVCCQTGWMCLGMLERYAMLPHAWGYSTPFSHWQ